MGSRSMLRGGGRSDLNLDPLSSLQWVQQYPLSPVKDGLLPRVRPGSAFF